MNIEPLDQQPALLTTRKTNQSNTHILSYKRFINNFIYMITCNMDVKERGSYNLMGRKGERSSYRPLIDNIIHICYRYLT